MSGIDAAGKQQLWVRPLDSFESTVLPGTEGAFLPFWSPDGRYVGFFADKKLKRVEVSGGLPVSLYDVDGLGGAWSPTGDILFTEPSGPVLCLPASGGKAVAVTRLDAATGETSHRFPFFLPDGKHFLYLSLRLAGNSRDPANRIWVGSTDGAPARPVASGTFGAQYADGLLLFVRGGDFGGRLFAQPFDLKRFATEGEEITVAAQVGLYGEVLGVGNYSVSQNGTLVYDASTLLTRFEWFDRGGKQLSTFGEPGPRFTPRISPDGSRIAFVQEDAGNQTSQIWIGDLARGIQTRLSGGPGTGAQFFSGPVWSPDGLRIAHQSDLKHQADVYVRDLSTGAEVALTDEDGQHIPQDWSSDGRYIVYSDREPAGQRLMQISVMPADGSGKPFVLLPRSPNDYGRVRFSPDSKWVAFDLDESGRREVYAVSFPDGRQKVQMSDRGGYAARWARGGKELLVPVLRQHGHVGRPRHFARARRRAAEASLPASGRRGIRLGRHDGRRAVHRERPRDQELVGASVGGRELGGRSKEEPMTLSAGTRLGPYEILSPLGAGGMGEVYRARDTRLQRDVAIKVLPERVAKDPEALARFEREARTVSQLSHPHIGAVYDVGREGDTEYLVMELLEGEMLSERLLRGPLPLEDVLRFGRQIAQALDAAHRRGVVHRDLKPGNIMLTKSGVKLLDFGLARALAPSSDALTHAATAAPNLTQDGFILGTVGYMSPEQAEGREIDARSDIFALGAVLYEMVTGRRAFEGGSRAATLSAVLTSQPPPIRSVRPEMPAAIEPLVSLCLAKDRDRRWQSAHDVDLQLEAIAGSASHPELLAASAPHRMTRAGFRGSPRGSSRPWPPRLLWKRRSAPPPPARTIQFPLLPPAGRAFFTTYETKTIAVSPDGSRIAFVSSSYATSAARRGIGAPDAPGSRGIWIRDLGSLESRPVPGTEDASSLFWSPDGKSLGFFTPGKLKRIQLVDGAAAVPICDVPLGGGTSGTWGSGGDILFASMPRSQILRVPASGGVPEKVIEASGRRGPDRLAVVSAGRKALSVFRPPAGGRGRVDARRARQGAAPDRRVALVSAVRRAGLGPLRAGRCAPRAAVRSRRGAPARRAHLGRGARELLLPLDRTRVVRRLAGRHARLSDPRRRQPADLVRPGGRALERIGPPGDYLNVSLSPSGGRVLYDRTRPGIGTLDIWSWDLSRGVETAVTTEAETEIAALELPDGKSIIYSARRRAGARAPSPGPRRRARRAIDGRRGLSKERGPFTRRQDARLHPALSLGELRHLDASAVASREARAVSAFPVRQAGGPFLTRRTVPGVHLQRVRPGRGLCDALSRTG